MVKIFDFSETNEEFIMYMDSYTILHITRISNSIAVLYFTDEKGIKINIPNDIIVYTYNYEDTKNKVIQKNINQEYALCWTDNYTIECGEEELINIKNQRKWNIQLH